MNWQKIIDLNTFHASWLTWNTYFRESVNSNITFNVFYQLAYEAKYKIITINQYISMEPENGGLHRLKAKTPEKAYEDKPRGENDIKRRGGAWGQRRGGPGAVDVAALGLGEDLS